MTTPEQIREAVREGGLLTAAGAAAPPVLVLLSGGRDSTCLLDVAVALRGPGAVSALHVNYGLRPRASAEEERCRELCGQLGVELEVVRPSAPPPAAPEPAGRAAGVDEVGGPAGNLQAWARELRYGAAVGTAGRRGAVIATGHTASDQVETILYRLAASPGRRALLGMPVRDGRLVRPLLGLTREQTAAYCLARGLAWSDDESNDDERYARARVRHRLAPALRSIHPAAEANVLRTATLLREETELLEELVEGELGGAEAISLARLEELPRALARMVVVALAERATGGYVPQAGSRVEELLDLGRRGGRAQLHVGGNAGAVLEGGMLSMVLLPSRG